MNAKLRRSEEEEQFRVDRLIQRGERCSKLTALFEQSANRTKLVKKNVGRRKNSTK